MTLSINAAQTALLTWNLVDSGKHLDYDGNSKYMANINYGADKWNSYKAGVIRTSLYGYCS